MTEAYEYNLKCYEDKSSAMRGRLITINEKFVPSLGIAFNTLNYVFLIDKERNEEYKVITISETQFKELEELKKYLMLEQEIREKKKKFFENNKYENKSIYKE